LSIRAIDETNIVNSHVDRQFTYYKIKEIGNCWEDTENGISQIMSRVIMGLHSVVVNFSLVVVSDGINCNIFLGVENIPGANEILSGLLYSNFPSIKLSDCEVSFVEAIENVNTFSNVGFIKGNPSGLEHGSQLDNIINGLKGKRWCYIVNAQPILKKDTIEQQKFFLDEYSKSSVLKDVSFSDTDNVENTSYKKIYLHADKYNEQMEQYNEKYAEAISVGEWKVTVQFGATNEADSYLLGGLIASAFYGEFSNPEAPHLIMGNGVMLSEGIANDIQNNVIGNFPYPIISTYLTSNELAIYFLDKGTTFIYILLFQIDDIYNGYTEKI